MQKLLYCIFKMDLYCSPQRCEPTAVAHILEHCSHVQCTHKHRITHTEARTHWKAFTYEPNKNLWCQWSDKECHIFKIPQSQLKAFPTIKNILWPSLWDTNRMCNVSWSSSYLSFYQYQWPRWKDYAIPECVTCALHVHFVCVCVCVHVA